MLVFTGVSRRSARCCRVWCSNAGYQPISSDDDEDPKAKSAESEMEESSDEWPVFSPDVQPLHSEWQNVPYHSALRVGGWSFHWGTQGWQVRWRRWHPAFVFIASRQIGLCSESALAEAVVDVQAGQGRYSLVGNNCNKGTALVLQKLHKPVPCRVWLMARPWLLALVLGVLICSSLLMRSAHTVSAWDNKCEVLILDFA